ncbi:MAG: sigma factor-like helix-turn-helix DNA-binding protein [Kofleriaceae bacterium]
MTPIPDASTWERVRAVHPALPDDREAFLAYARARADGGTLDDRHAEDLYLAWACAQGDTAALATFERDIVPIVARALTSFSDRHEVLQILRERMLVARPGQGRRATRDLGIVAFDGRAPLATWLRVCATRIGLREHLRARRLEAVDDAHLAELAPGVPDPGLAYLRRLYGDSFRTAFDAAVASLAPRARNLLRMSVIDGLGIDQLAKIFHVHRSTVARRLELAREALVAATRERMRAELAISESELDSIMRVLTDVTIRHALEPRKTE